MGVDERLSLVLMAVRDVGHCFVFVDHELHQMHGVFHDVLSRDGPEPGKEGAVEVHSVEMHSSVDSVEPLLVLLDHDVLLVVIEACIPVSVHNHPLQVPLMYVSSRIR